MNLQKRLNKCQNYFNDPKFVKIMANEFLGIEQKSERIMYTFPDLNLSLVESKELARGFCGLLSFCYNQNADKFFEIARSERLRKKIKNDR